MSEDEVRRSERDVAGQLDVNFVTGSAAGVGFDLLEAYEGNDGVVFDML